MISLLYSCFFKPAVIFSESCPSEIPKTHSAAGAKVNAIALDVIKSGDTVQSITRELDPVYSFTDSMGTLYEGEGLIHGELNGLGKITYYETTNEHRVVKRIEEGLFRKNQLDGEGTIIWPSYRKKSDPNSKCQTYSGVFVKGILQKGEKYYIDGTTNRGIFEVDAVDEFNGYLIEGIIEFPNGGGKAGFYSEGFLTHGLWVAGFRRSYCSGSFDQNEELINGVVVKDDGITQIHRRGVLYLSRPSTNKEMANLLDPNLLEKWQKSCRIDRAESNKLEEIL